MSVKGKRSYPYDGNRNGPRSRCRVITCGTSITGFSGTGVDIHSLRLGTMGSSVESRSKEPKKTLLIKKGKYLIRGTKFYVSGVTTISPIVLRITIILIFKFCDSYG